MSMPSRGSAAVTALGIIAALLAGATGTSAADADEATASPAVTVERDAVPSQATGFALRYAFGPGVFPAEQKITFDGASGAGPVETPYNWADAEGSYLQWDYAMTQAGSHTVVYTAQLIDTGKLTDYSVQYTSKINRTGGSIAVDTDCAVLFRGTQIDIGDDSPFACEGVSAQAASGTVLAASTIALFPWAQITATIDVRNVDDTAPQISLAKGTLGTTNQDRRIIMNGTSWYPFHDDGSPVADVQYATIPNGGSLTWSAAALNSAARSQSEVNSHGQGYFVYEIVLGGQPTGYWLKGTAETYKWDSWWYPSATCEIYAGDPNGNGRPATEATPFTCTPTGMTKPNVNFADDTTFEVRMASVDTLYDKVAAQMRGVNEACSQGSRPCTVTTGRVTRQTYPPAVPNVHAGGSTTHTNDHGGRSGELGFSFTFSREVKNTFEQMYGITTTAESKTDFFGQKVKLSVEVSSETTFGYDVANGFDVTQDVTEEVPFWSSGAYYYVDVYDQHDSDVYFVGQGDVWYRVTGASIDVPVPSQIPTASNNGPLVEPASAGAPIPGLTFQCSWIEGRADKILGKIIADLDAEHQIMPGDRKVDNYAEALNECTVPATWSALKESAFTGADRHLKWEVLQTYLADQLAAEAPGED